MDVFELFDLSNWYRSQHKQLNRLYSELHTALSNNANQPTKVPIAGPLAALVQFLEEMPVGELSLQQLALLDHLGVGKLLGTTGARWIEGVVKAEAYDPATTDKEVAAAVSTINNANNQLSAYGSAIDQLAMVKTPSAEEKGRVTVRVGFRNDASIRNVTEWKSSADDWYQIVRGLSLMSGEAPEETHVVGASTGSIILVLSMTYGVSKLLASIAKHITGTAKDILTLQITCEELRQKKILTATMEAEFKNLQAAARARATNAIEEELSVQVPGTTDGEKKSALAKSIQKLLAFGEEGGDIDFVAPVAPEPGQEAAASGSPDEMIATIRSVRNLILEYQEEREAVKRLAGAAHERHDARAS